MDVISQIIVVWIPVITLLILVYNWLIQRSRLKKGLCRVSSHRFQHEELINIRIDPKCTNCGRSLSEVTRFHESLSQPFTYTKHKSKFTLIEGGRGNA